MIDSPNVHGRTLFSFFLSLLGRDSPLDAGFVSNQNIFAEAKLINRFRTVFCSSYFLIKSITPSNISQNFSQHSKRRNLFFADFFVRFAAFACDETKQRFIRHCLLLDHRRISSPLPLNSGEIFLNNILLREVSISKQA